MLTGGSVIAAAANIRTAGSNKVTLADFLEIYPQFAAVPEAYVTMILDNANQAIQESRWHSKWKLAVCLYTAHFCTLWLKTKPEDGASGTAIARKADGAGNVTSKSVGGVNVSYGAAEGSADLHGYGAWKETEYGLQLATLARIVGHGMMVVR